MPAERFGPFGDGGGRIRLNITRGRRGGGDVDRFVTLVLVYPFCIGAAGRPCGESLQLGQVILRNRGVTFKRDKLLQVLLLVRSCMNTKLGVGLGALGGFFCFGLVFGLAVLF